MLRKIPVFVSLLLVLKILSSNGDLQLQKNREWKYGNEVFFAETKQAARAELHFDVEYDVVRHERIALNPAPQMIKTRLSEKQRRQDLQPDALVPTNGRPADLAVKSHTRPRRPPGQGSRYLRLRVLDHEIRQDRHGWGRGDVLYACNARKGNCTDFHSLFIAMARSQGLPACFEIGFPLLTDKRSAEIASYHCWSDFYIEGKEWIPVDISEAWKHPEKRDYFFGSHDVNRVQFSMGRDLRLNPQQEGKPLNYFLCPYVEVDGQEYPNVSVAFSFADVASAVAQDKREHIQRYGKTWVHGGRDG